MAKKLDLFKSTEPTPAEEINLAAAIAEIDLDEGLLIPAGVGLTVGERQAIDLVAQKINAPRNKVLRLAIRRFILDIKNERLDLESKIIEPTQPEKRPKNKIKLPTE